MFERLKLPLDLKGDASDGELSSQTLFFFHKAELNAAVGDAKTPSLSLGQNAASLVLVKHPSTLSLLQVLFLPGQGYFPCATAHSAGARQAPWWSLQLSQKGLSIPEPSWG